MVCMEGWEKAKRGEKGKGETGNGICCVVGGRLN
jgi:hypothetical protein